MINHSPKVKTALFVSAFSLLPLIVWAQDITSILLRVTQTLRNIIALLFVIATMVFLWGVVTYIGKTGDPQGEAKARGIMTWGIVGLAVMAAAWGVTTILINYFFSGNA